MLFLTLFLLLELPSIGRSIVSLLPPEQADRAIHMQAEISSTVARYVATNIAVSVFAGIVTWISLELLGVPFALVLALLMGLFDLLPLIGATLGGAIVVIVATITVGVTAGVIMIVVLVVYQQTENHLVQPIVMKRSVAVSPLIVIVSVLVGAALLGILGALLAIPVAGSVADRAARHRGGPPHARGGALLHVGAHASSLRTRPCETDSPGIRAFRACGR